MTNGTRLKKKHLVAVFAVSFTFNIMMLMCTLTAGWSNDDISVFFGAARLAGLDWSGITDAYQGQGYYILFAPVFMITDNPLTRHLIIQVINMAVISAVSVLIYYIAVSFFQLKNNYFTALLPLIITAFTSHVDVLARNEVAVFLTVWVTCLILLCLCNTTQNKHRIVLSLLLVLMLCYCLLIHTRMVGFVLAISLAILIYFIIFKKWVVQPLVFFPAMVLGYIGYMGVRELILLYLWDGKAAGEVSNTTLRLIADAERIPSVRAIFDIFTNNIYSLTVRTYGIAAIAVILAVYLIYRLIVSIKKHRAAELDKDIDMPRDQFFLLLVFGISIIGTILGMCTFWGQSIDTAIATGEATHGVRGLQYTRYYAAYFGPIMLVMYSYFAKRRKQASRFCLSAAGLFILLYAYVRYVIYPYAEHLNFTSAGHREFIPPFFMTDVTFESTLIFITFMILIYAVFLYVNCGKHFYVLAFSIILTFRLSDMSRPFFNVEAQPPVRQLYQVLDDVKKETPLPYEIYAKANASLIQYLFSHNRVVDGEPDIASAGDSIFICHAGAADEYEALGDSGYSLYIIGEHALWLRGDALNEALPGYVERITND